MQSGKRRVGLMGGTFDPIHYGHLFIAEEARVRCGLEEVLWVPTRQPAHVEGKTAHADAETRWRLTTLAVEPNPYFRVSRVELDRPGPSYAIDTVQQLQAELGEAEIFYIVGADSIQDILTWRRAPELLEQCRFIALSREGFDLDEAKRRFSREQRERVEWLETIIVPLSSTKLRQRVRENLPLKYLTPDAVVAEIEKLGLYR